MIVRTSLMIGLLVALVMPLNADWGVITSDDQMVMLTAEQQEKLKDASEYFRLVFSENWQEGQEKIITLDTVRAPTFNDFMQLLDIAQPEIVTQFLKNKSPQDFFELAVFADYVNYHRWDDQMGPILAAILVQPGFLRAYQGKPIALSALILDALKSSLRVTLHSDYTLLRVLAHPVFADHSNWVDSVALTANEALVTGALDGVARVWHMQTGNCLQTLAGHAHVISHVMCTRDGKLITGSRDYNVRVWDIQAGHCLCTLAGHTNFITGLLLTPDGKRLITSSADRTARVWDTHTWQCLQVLNGHADWILCMVLTADGRLITGSGDCTARVWDIQTGDCVRVLRGHTGIVRSMLITPDGKLVTGAGSILGRDDDCTARVWDIQTGSCVRVLRGHTAIIYCMKLTPEGQVITGSFDGVARVWDIATGRCLRKLRSHSGKINTMVVAPDNRVIIGYESGMVRVWDIATGQCMRCWFGHTGVVWCMALTSDGKLVTGSHDGSACLWGSPIPKIETLSVEQLLLVLKIVTKNIDASQAGDPRMQELYNSLPEATRCTLAEQEPGAAHALAAHPVA